MNIRIFSKLEGGIYQITIKTEDWSENDKLLMQRFGEPTVELGGTFMSETVPYLEFTLPASSARIMTESPFTSRFDFRDNADAEDRANLWKTEATSRITDAVAELRANEDAFTKEEVITI